MGLVTADEGATLAAGNVRDAEKPLDLANITQWHIAGDFSGGKPMDVEVGQILLVSEKEVPELAVMREARIKRHHLHRQRITGPPAVARCAHAIRAGH